jgi:acyl-CoA thioester hydrolase
MGTDDPARIVVQRKVEWPDTDATGHWHYSTAVRWAEAAETALYSRLGLLELYGMAPRVRFEVDFCVRLWFADLVDIAFRVALVGNSSVRFEFEVRRGETVAVVGSVTAVHVDKETGRSSPWPERVRRLFLEGGEQRPERLG